MTRAERKILLFTSAAHTLTHIFMLAFPALVMPISRDLGIIPAQVMSMSFWGYLLYGVLSAPWGAASDRIGHKWVLCVGLLISGTGLILAGVSATPGAIAASFALVGIGGAAYHPSAASLLARSIQERGRAMGINGVWGNVGMAVVPFMVGLLNLAIGWQKGLVLLGALGCALSVGGALIRLGAERREEEPVPRQPLARSAAIRLAVLFGIAVIFSGLTYHSYTVILPSFLEYRLGDPSEVFRRWVERRVVEVADVPAFKTLVANLVATAVYVVGAIGQAAAGRLADRHSPKWLYFSSYAIALPFLLAAAWTTDAWLIPTVGAFMFFALGALPLENVLVALLIPARWQSISYGIKYTLVFGVGSIAVKLVAWQQASSGLPGTIWLIAGLAACFLMVMGWFLRSCRGTVFQTPKRKKRRSAGTAFP